MGNVQQRLDAFVKLGSFLGDYCDWAAGTKKQDPHFAKLDTIVAMAGQKNGWFTKDNILYAFRHWSKLLTKKQLENWLVPYPIIHTNPMTVALIMAGNIPLVGFHDFLSVWLTGNNALVKLSSNDTVLLPFLVDFMVGEVPNLKKHITFTDGRLTDFDAVIATGSNNTTRYFDYYFSHKPHIIRKNRNSIAVLTGNETPAQLEALGEDIFRYFGLGCRSVSKIFVPKDYNFEGFFKAIFHFKDIIDLKKYANNYDYNKAVYLMSEFKILDNGFLILKEDTSYASPIASLFYEKYDAVDRLKTKLNEDREHIQCIVADGLFGNEVAFGETQRPGLDTYADNVDTIGFLLKNSA